MMRPIQNSIPPEAPAGIVRSMAVFLAVGALILLGGCSDYVLQGRAVMGDYSTVELVEPDDPRLGDAPVPGVTIEVVRDPMSLGRKTVTRGTSGGTGAVSISIGEFGAGFLDEQWEFRVVRKDVDFASNLIKLPFDPDSKRILVVIRRGDGKARNSLGVEAEKQLGGEESRIPRDSVIFR
ncbi:MAG: hypothetical protein VX672_02460 [Planctomycetota bacterium]|nr:hypothetical protein [Planctomycetota bacterium]